MYTYMWIYNITYIYICIMFSLKMPWLKGIGLGDFSNLFEDALILQTTMSDPQNQYLITIGKGNVLEGYQRVSDIFRLHDRGLVS